MKLRCSSLIGLMRLCGYSSRYADLFATLDALDRRDHSPHVPPVPSVKPPAASQPDPPPVLPAIVDCAQQIASSTSIVLAPSPVPDQPGPTKAHSGGALQPTWSALPNPTAQTSSSYSKCKVGSFAYHHSCTTRAIRLSA